MSKESRAETSILAIEESTAALRAAMKDAWRIDIEPRAGRVTPREKGKLRERVTEADLAASERLVKVCRRYFAASYSEEDHPLLPNQVAPLLWQIDPLDGTEAFIEGHLEWVAIQGALLKRNSSGLYEACVGVLYCPGRDRIWWNDLSGKLYCEEAGKVSERKTPHARAAHPLRGCHSPLYLPRKELTRYYELLAAQNGYSGYALVDAGGAGSQVDLLLSGEADAGIISRNDSKEWDVSMAVPLLGALGGAVCDFSGQPFNFQRHDHYNRGGVLWSALFSAASLSGATFPGLLVEKI